MHDEVDGMKDPPIAVTLTHNNMYLILLVQIGGYVNFCFFKHKVCHTDISGQRMTHRNRYIYHDYHK